jgi:iron complex transport system ATP-binding protein
LRAQIRGGKTLLLVTHHLHEIPPEVECVVLLREGRIVADGRKDSLMTDDNMSALFDRSMTLVRAHGWYQAVPAPLPSS